MKINLPVGTPVSFNNDLSHTVYHISYQQLLGPCPPDCTLEHDCYTEPYVAVYYTIGTARPLKNLKYIFDANTGQGKIIKNPLKLLK